MCHAEEIRYCCGHFSMPVVRPCPLTTSGHNNPVCKIQYTHEFIADTMCVVCERVLHSRWTLLQEWEHRWYHERGVCSCKVTFPELDTTHIILPGNENSSGSDGETTLAGTPVSTAERDKPGNCLFTNELDSSIDTEQLTGGGSHRRNHVQGPVVSGAKEGQGTSSDGIPALFEERTDSDKTRVAIRQASQYAAEWLDDHRAVHAAGKCHCNIDTKSMTEPMTKGAMTPEEAKVLILHRQITGEGMNPEEWTPPSKEEVDRWRKETGVNELGTKAIYTCHTRRAPDMTKYPVPLADNMYLTDSFVVWDHKLLTERLKSVQMASKTKGNGLGPTVTVKNGRVSDEETIYVYQPNANGHPRDMRKKGYRRQSGRNRERRGAGPGWQDADPFANGPPANMLPVWQQQAYHGPSAVQQSMPSAQYGYPFFPQEQQAIQYGPNAVHGMGYQQQQVRTEPAMTPSRSASPPQQKMLTNMTADGILTPPQEHDESASIAFHPIHGAETVLGLYELSPPNTHAAKAMNGQARPRNSNKNQASPSKQQGKIEAQPTATPAAIANETRQSSNQSGSSRTLTSGNNTSSGVTSVAATPSGSSGKGRKRSAARNLKLKLRKEEDRKRKAEERQKKDGAATEQQQPRNNITPLCGLPIGAGPESCKPHMPAFENCALFYSAIYPANYAVIKHRRGSSCPEFHLSPRSTD